jgi:transketolase
MPSWELFEETSQEYKDQLLPPEITARMAIEAGIPMGWDRYIGDRGSMIGINHFGASAPGSKVLAEFGFTSERIVQKAMALL